MNTNQGKAPHSSSLSAKALEYYRMYSGNDELPKYFCGSYDLTSQPSSSNKRVSDAPNIPEIIVEDYEPTPASPTSSITSTKKLEWDSGADIGYANYDPHKLIQKSTSMPMLRRQNSKSKSESSELGEIGDIDESKSRRRELMMFLRLKVGHPAAESTPFERDLKKAGSDPEIYISHTPRKKQSVPQRRLHTTTFNYEVRPSDSFLALNHIGDEVPEDSDDQLNISKEIIPNQNQDVASVSASTCLILEVASSATSHSSKSSQHSSIDDTLPDKTKYFNRYRLKKIRSLRLSAPVSIECTAAAKKSDCDVETQTTMCADKSQNTSVAIQTSRRSSKQEIVYLFHPSIQCDDKTTSSASSHSVIDQAFSNCNSFEYVSGKENEVDAAKSTSSTLQSIDSKKSIESDGDMEKNLQLMQKLIKSNKYDDGIKELYIRKIAKKMVQANNNHKESEPSTESDKIVPVLDRNTIKPQRATASNSSSTSTKVVTSNSSENNKKDWKNSQNETHSERLYSSLESTDSPKETLVSFAKRERESQINWINSEIEHLAKLKSLLETKKKKSSLKATTTASMPDIPTYQKSTAVYMITTEKKGAGGDCADDCCSKTKKFASGQIDFHVHNNLGVRDYHFKEIITKITPDSITPQQQQQQQQHEVPTTSHTCPNLNINNQPLYVSDPCKTNYMRNNCCRPCRCCPLYPETTQPAYCHAPTHYQRDIHPVPATEAPERSRSSSPKSTSITDDTSGYPSRRKTPGRPQTAPANKKQKEKVKTKRSSQRDSITSELESTTKDFKANTLAQLRKAGITPPETTREPVKTVSEESISRYESLSKYNTKSLSSKGSNQTRPAMITLAGGVLGTNNNKTSCLRGTTNYYCAAREQCVEGCPAGKPLKSPNPTPDCPPKCIPKCDPRPQKKSDEIRSYKDYKASKLKDTDRKRLPTIENEVPSIERFTNTEGPWKSNDENEEYVDCNTPAFSSKGMCACPKAVRKKCQCTISATDDVSLQTTQQNRPELSEKGMKTDEPPKTVDGKETQVSEEKPEMKQMGVGNEARKRDNPALSVMPAAVVTYTPSNVDSSATGVGGRRSYKMVKDLSKINLSSAVVISSVVTTSVANPEDNIRRLILEMPLDEKSSKNGKGKKGEHVDAGADNDSNTGFSSAVNSICSCSQSSASTRATTTAGSTSEVMCSCCGKCVASSDSLLGDAGPRNGPSGGPFCWPCYHQSTTREWNPQEPYYQQADHLCNCYNKVDENALDKIRETLRQLAEIDNCPDAPSGKASSPSKCEKLICKSCNKKIKRDPVKKPDKKPVAYVLKFEPGEEVEEEDPQQHLQSLQEIRVKVPMTKSKKKKKGSDNDTSGTEGRNSRKTKETESRENKNLQDYLSTNRPDFVRSAEERRRCLIELAYMREQRCQKYKQLLALSNGIPTQDPSYSDKKKVRLFTTKEMKRMTAKNYKKLPEVQQKLLDYRDRQNKKANRLLADIFNKKLRENVLRGQASLSTSISVINLM